MIIKEQSTHVIKTKYLGATNTKGERIKAVTVYDYGRPDTVTLPYDYALSDCSISEKITAHQPYRQIKLDRYRLHFYFSRR